MKVERAAEIIMETYGKSTYITSEQLVRMIKAKTKKKLRKLLDEFDKQR